VLLRRIGKDWTYPAFYSLGSPSLGLQAGVSSAQIVLLLMTDRAVGGGQAGAFPARHRSGPRDPDGGRQMTGRRTITATSSAGRAPAASMPALTVKRLDAGAESVAERRVLRPAGGRSTTSSWASRAIAAPMRCGQR